MLRRLSILVVLLALPLATSCKQKRKAQARGGERDDEKVEAPDTREEPKQEDGPRFVPAGDGEVKLVVLEQLARSGAEERDLLVYVGADWCEPCKHFHAAVEDGKLDQAFPKLTLLEFDAGIDRERLVEAGYDSRLVPLFAAPGPDGLDSGRRFEGSVKGPEAIDNIVPRLEKLLEMARADRAAWGRTQG